MLRRNLLASVAMLLTLRAATAAPQPHEQLRIDRLIRFVETQQSMTFIRNGAEYSSADAGRFLRGKLEAMGREVTTAREFIERIATKSSLSGRPYQVKFADGRTVLASQFLADELKRLDALPAPG